MKRSQKMKCHSHDSLFQSRATAANFLLHTLLTASSKATPTSHKRKRVTPTSHHPSQQLPLQNPSRPFTIPSSPQ